MSDVEPKQGRRWLAWQMKAWQVLLVALLSLLIGVGIGGAGSTGEETPADVKAAASPESVADTTTTTDARTTTTEGHYVPAPADFTLTVVTTKQSCFGSAGCNVSYEIDLNYHGPKPLGANDEWSLIYEVRGGEDTKIGTITTQGDRYSKETGYVSTGSNPHLEAIVTTVREA